MKMVTTNAMMKTTGAKICGLSTAADVAAALEGGADFIGFVIFPPSPRHVSPAQAAALAEPARGRAGIVAVTVDADDALIDEIAAVLRPDFVQLHGDETPDRVREVRARTGAKVIRALRVETAQDIVAAAPFRGVADLVMYDARPPKDAVLPGGNGASFDWSLASAIPRGDPWFLAGGLNPANVIDAVTRTGAPLVDVSSGVERAPGYKDPFLIRAFLDAVRSVGHA